MLVVKEGHENILFRIKEVPTEQLEYLHEVYTQTQNPVTAVAEKTEETQLLIDVMKEIGKFLTLSKT